MTSTGDARFVLPLQAPPGRGNVSPSLALAFNSSGGDGELGAGFSLTGASSSITRCPKDLAQDGEIRAVRYDAQDKLCLDGKPLVIIEEKPGAIEYRTVPDTFEKVIGHDPDQEGTPRSFEVFEPSGLVVEYGTDDGARPLGPGGIPRAWLAAVARDGRGNAMTYSYCFADADGYTAEYALDEIRYTRFDGSAGEPPLEASRAVKLVHGTKEPAAVRTIYSGGMELQSSLRLDAVQMVGPGEELVRSYTFTYALSPTTSRTLLTQVEECASDGVCKPPARFRYKSATAGFRERTTGISSPTSLKASPLLLDMDADGLADLVLPDTDKALTTPQNPITRWFVAHNGGASASPETLAPAKLAFSQEGLTVAEPTQPADPTQIQPELGTVIDYNQDGRKDILLHDVYGASVNWQVLLAAPDRTLKALDTGIPRPFPLNALPVPPGLSSRGGSMHLADVNGDHVPDLIQCEDHGTSVEGDPSKAVWTVHLWKPAQGAAAAGFDPAGEAIEPLATMRCDLPVSTVDLDSDGKVDLVIQSVHVGADGSEVASATYAALARLEDGSWERWGTELPVVEAGGRVLFLDVNGDGLPDAVESGFQNGALYTYINTGRSSGAASGAASGSAFASSGAAPILSLGSPGLGGQDLYFDLAVPLDYNGDGRQDLLVPMPPDMLPADSESSEPPAWVILQANGGMQVDATFTMVDPHIPFEAALGDAVTLADPRGPRIGDLNGDGASDVLLPLGGEFHLFENLATDQDVLVAVTDGMNAHDPADEGFVPNVTISYGHLIDDSITTGITAGDPVLERQLYLSHSGVTNDCAYPVRCAVGSRRVVNGYTLNDGADGVRRFAVRYRDGRYHQLGAGFLGFGERIVVDLDTLATTADFYDNVTFDDKLGVAPFAQQLKAQWRVSPGLPNQPDPHKIELSFLDVTLEAVPSNDGKTYFTLPARSHLRRAQGTYAAGSSGAGLEEYARNVEQGGGNATLLRDTTAKVTAFDDFGHVRSEEIATAGVDFTLKTDRTFKNDTDRWVLGQLQTQKECSTAAKLTQCRTLTRTTTIYGEVKTESIETDDGSPETRLDVVYGHDDFGNINSVTAEDAFGHHRASTILYEPEGIFPREHINAAKHSTFTEFDAGLGALTSYTDPNGLVTRWKHDGFGRTGLELRPDGTQTSFTLSRTKGSTGNKDGAGKDAWRVRQRTTTSGGADDEVELDSLGRPVRWWWHRPVTATDIAGGFAPRIMQQVDYDAWSGKVARRSVPDREGIKESDMLFDTHEFDALGREVRHTTPWNAVTETSYDGLFVTVTDPLDHVTVSERDALGRLLVVTDAEKGLTSYTYGPFGWLFTVTDPGGALTRTTRDALGRIRKMEDPDRGTTTQVHDGFGELLSSTDALNRVVTFEPDALGRTKTRIDQVGADVMTTTWTWDTAINGIGKLHELASPDGVKTYSYNALGRLESLALRVTGESDTMVGKLGYDSLGRVDTITYPQPAGMHPFVVQQDHDPYGHVLEVRDQATGLAYWHLTDVDSAGRYRGEAFGNNVTTERDYDPAKQQLKSLVTKKPVTGGGATMVQKLSYDYDALLNLERRTDALQPKYTAERFRYDGLERLTCAYFSVFEDASAPCASSYDYAPNGNLTFKSDIGVLAYDDPAHPHAVTSAGFKSFGYDAAGNQTARHGGVSIEYTPFDLPGKITQGASTTTFGYDGDQQRIRKTTPATETVYFGQWYERVTAMGSGTTDATEHRYYIHSPERVVAVVTQGGKNPGTLYVHTDHLGSVDALTDAGGTVVERRSYDAFGQQRNPEWGEPPLLPPKRTTLGFTGHESDSEFGLVNMKGRMFDPKLGRFLTTDPIISDLSFGQSINAYSYVLNNPLTYVDPSGFAGEPPAPKPDPDEVGPTRKPQVIEITIHGERPVQPLPRPKDTGEKVGVAVPATDTDTTGNTPPEPPDTEPPDTETESDDWRQNPYVQSIGGFFGGLALGLVPFAGAGQQVLDEGGVLPHGTPEARRGLAVGQIVGGIFTLVGGLTGEVLGGIATVTGIGAVIGVPAMAVSTVMVVGGATNIMAGLRGLSQSMMSTGSGSGPSNPRRFSTGDRDKGFDKSKDTSGVQKCEYCDRQLDRNSGKPNSYEADHRQAHSKGGPSDQSNLAPSCRTCNRSKGSKDLGTEWTPPKNRE